MPWTYSVRTDKDTHFTGALATNAVEDEDVVLPPALQGVAGNAHSHIRALTVWSDQNLAWELNFFSSDTDESADADLDTFIGRWEFVAADGKQIAGTGLFRYYIEGLAIPYVDDDKTGELHISLVNRDATSKSAGAGGEIVVEVFMEPMVSEGGF